MNVLGIKPREWGGTNVFWQMRGSPMIKGNIWNISIYKKNIYKKQIDNNHPSVTSDRNTLERTGTTFNSLFHKCSATSNCRNTSQTRVVRGLQARVQKSCSAMFRLSHPSAESAERPVNRGLAAIHI
jgi:hypothetical protein